MLCPGYDAVRAICAAAQQPRKQISGLAPDALGGLPRQTPADTLADSLRTVGLTCLHSPQQVVFNDPEHARLAAEGPDTHPTYRM